MDVRDASQQSERNDEKHKASSSSDGFGLAVSRIAVAQLCESVGFQSVQGSALDVLSDVAVWYMYNVGRSAQFFANLSGRAEGNTVDIVQALGDLGSVQGFAGAADVHRCVVASDILRDIGYYLSTSEEVQFVRRVLNFPIAGSRKTIQSFAQSDEAPPGGHIPNWLPVFPDRNTYDRSLVENVRMDAPKVEREERVGQQRKVASSVLALKKFLAGNRSDMGVSTDETDFVKERQTAAEGNPFLAPLLPFGSKEVSRLDFKPVVSLGKDVKDHQDFAPPMNVENGALDGADVGENALPRLRPTVQFRLGSGKRSLGSSLPLCIDGTEERDFMDLRNVEKNDKKHRKQQVLRKSTEYTRECNMLQDPV